MTKTPDTHETVQDYYGRELQGTSDLKTDACCDASSVPDWLKRLLKNIHPEVLSRYYGCGLVCPPLLEGCRVLDLGSGSGRDVYALAQLVGPTGSVVGVDMTDEQLAVAEETRGFHIEAFGYDNVRFLKGYIEKLDELDLEPESFDVIVSNCVINLSPDKAAVLNGVRRLLKPGGEFFFSDVYADRRVPDAVRNDPVLYGECLGGALYWHDFVTISKQAGFADPRLVEDRPLEVTDPELSARVGDLNFFSATYRLFKLDGLEAGREDYGQTVTYQGGIPDNGCQFLLDKDQTLATGEAVRVCGNTWRMLQETRFKDHFTFEGDFSHHRGIFTGSAAAMPFDEASETPTSGGCC
ncbi:MAG: methyltransferase type 11 [Alphaproteobacteria bacterium]|nr:MAG: methyltransferase type 11 [Alphaproteobacteria bacterium]